MTEKTRVLRKLSTKTILGARPKPPEERTFLYRLAGRINGMQAGEGDNGPWVKFKGSFQAQRFDGTVFASPAAFFPQPFQDSLESAIMERQANGEAVSIETAVDIFIVPDESAATGYVYEGEPVMEVQDDTANLLARLNAETPLPALTHDKAEEKPTKKAAKK
jgi:hypothetical protein